MTQRRTHKTTLQCLTQAAFLHKAALSGCTCLLMCHNNFARVSKGWSCFVALMFPPLDSLPSCTRDLSPVRRYKSQVTCGLIEGDFYDVYQSPWGTCAKCTYHHLSHEKYTSSSTRTSIRSLKETGQLLIRRCRMFQSRTCCRQDIQ